MTAYTGSTRNTVAREIGLTGKVVVGGTVSTGMLLGGYTVGALALEGRTNGGALLATSLGLFVVGAVAGLVISVVLGVVGREAGRSIDDAIRNAGMGLLYAVPAAAVGAVLAGWIAMAIVGLYAGKALAVGASIAAAMVGLGVIAATFRTTCACAANLVRRAMHAV